VWRAGIVLFVLTTACGGSGIPRPTSTKTYKIVFSGHVTPTDPASKAQARFAELAKSMSNGQLDVQVFYNNQLGNTADGYSQLHAGTTQLEMLTPDHMVPYGTQHLGIPSLPFIFSSPEQVQKTS